MYLEIEHNLGIHMSSPSCFRSIRRRDEMFREFETAMCSIARMRVTRDKAVVSDQLADRLAYWTRCPPTVLLLVVDITRSR